MNKKIFLIGGATSGFGKAIAELLLQKGAYVIAVARNEAGLIELKNKYSEKVNYFVGDITDINHHDTILGLFDNQPIYGALINAGGPPAKTTLETSLEDWDNAYNILLRWKVALTQKLVNKMMPLGFGRIIFIESSSVKQPIENLVLSNSLRLAVVGMVKTLSQEIANSGITLNIIAPGSHDTPAINRLYIKKSEQTGLDFETVKMNSIQQIPVRKLGNPNDLAELALFLFSEKSGFITGQTIAVDGGIVKSSL